MSAKKVILLVEDDEASQYIFSTLLQHRGYRTEIAVDAERGFERIKESQPALIIMDVGLPEMDGVTMTRMLKSDPATRDIPILVLTVFAFDHDRQEALHAGADRFVPKPAEKEELYAIVEELIGPP